jgi:hypothetical protein
MIYSKLPKNVLMNHHHFVKKIERFELETMLKFLESHAECALISGRKENKITKAPETSYNTHLRGNLYKPVCLHCKGRHALRSCREILRMNLNQRQQKLRNLGVCQNCLAGSHRTEQCGSRFNCRYCQERHLYLLCHMQQSTVSVVHGVEASELPIMNVEASIGNGEKKSQSVLIDTGAQYNLIRRELVEGAEIYPFWRNL